MFEFLKKRKTSIMITILLIAFISIILGLIDYSRIKNNNYPIFCIKMNGDNSKEESCYGLGYQMTREIAVSSKEPLSESLSLKLGLWFRAKEININKFFNVFYVTSLDKREYWINEVVRLENSNIETKISKIEKIIKDKINKQFDKNDYILKLSESQNNTSMKKYDLSFVIAEAETSIGYTVYFNENETKLLKVFDNMQGYNGTDIKTNYEDEIKLKINNLSNAQKEKIRKDAISYSFKVTYPKKIINESKFYDVKDNKLYYVIDVEESINIQSQSGLEKTTYVYDYRAEI